MFPHAQEVFEVPLAIFQLFLLVCAFAALGTILVWYENVILLGSRESDYEYLPGKCHVEMSHTEFET